MFIAFTYTCVHLGVGPIMQDYFYMYKSRLTEAKAVRVEPCNRTRAAIQPHQLGKRLTSSTRSRAQKMMMIGQVCTIVTIVRSFMHIVIIDSTLLAQVEQRGGCYSNKQLFTRGSTCLIKRIRKKYSQQELRRLVCAKRTVAALKASECETESVNSWLEQ